ncbi:MAG: energy transducer TonB [Pseudomonadota bacterium]
MSYHAQKSTGQRSFGLFFVIGFHIVLIYGLASGLAGNVSTKISEVLQTKVVEEIKPEEVVEPPPPPPDTKIPPPDFVPPPSFDFVPDAPANTTAIQAVQHTVAKPVAEPTTMSKAKSPTKGLSRPEYPSASIRLGEEGSVGLQLYLNEEGRVTEAKVAASSGFERLDESAVKHAQRSWKFIPCMQGDKPVACWHTIKFTFKIEDAKK